MPWCPNCKNEYKAGISVCSDCNAILVESLDQIKNQQVVKYIFGEKDEMEQLASFLEFGGVSFVNLRNDETVPETESWFIEINEEELRLAERLTSVFSKEQAKKTKEVDDLQDTEQKEAQCQTGKGAVFVKASEKAENYRSSAYALLFAGVLGIIAIILILTGIIPVSLAPNIRMISFITMLVMFCIFIAIGIKSFVDSRKYASMASAEEQKTEDILKFFLGQYTRESLDTAAGLAQNNELAEEVRYFKRIEFMNQKLREQFGDIEPSFLEKTIDDLYTEIYEH